MTTSVWLNTALRPENLRFLAYYLGVITLSMSGLAWAFADVWHFHLPLRVVWFTLPTHTLLTAIAILTALFRPAISERLYLLLLLLSLGITGFFLYDTGGHTNPLISLLLLPLAMSAAILSRLSTFLLAGMAVGLYTALTRFYIPLAGHHGDHAQHHVMHIHLIGMWLTFGVSVTVIVGLITPLAASMRRQREYISQQREIMMRDERLIAMATFAASAAHQLGTPLSTLLVITDDLRDTLADRPELQQDLALMHQQIQLCKQTLNAMMRRADHLRHGEPVVLRVDEWLTHLRHQFNLLQPARSLAIRRENLGDASIRYDETLDQAILNLLDNAVRASDEEPALQARREGERLLLQIIDQGPGMPESVKQQWGQPWISTRDDGSGMGLGLFLSHATIDRHGGRLRVLDSQRGNITEIELPLSMADNSNPRVTSR